MATFYSDIFKVLDQFKKEREQREQFLKQIPDVRAQLYRSYIFPELDTFIPVEWVDGSIVLTPGNQTADIYRGQPEEYSSCVPSIYRGNPTSVNIFEARLKQCEFESVIKKHPAILDISQQGGHISYTGLAQHYRFRTDFLDATSDPWVAAFFAVCRWSEAEGRYLPIKESEKPGVLMKTPSLVFDLINPAKYPKLQPIGLQPLPRPGNQKAYAVQLDKGEDFSAHSTLFRQSKKRSEYVYNWFEGGKRLFPPDPLQEKADEIRSGTVFAAETISMVFARYSFPENADYYLQRLGVEITDSSPYDFTEDELSQFQDDWESEGRKGFQKQIGPTRLMYKG